MRILHTSDWHIGRQFHNVSLLEDQSFVLDQILDIARVQKADVILICGDVYDRSVPPAGAIELLDDVFNRICSDLQVPVILIAGNHDGSERLGFGSRQMTGAGLHIISSLKGGLNPVVLEDAHGPVAFYGIPYTDPPVFRNLYQAEATTHDAVISHLCSLIRDRHDNRQRCVALAHLFLDGGEASESERPLSVGGLDRVSAGHFGFFNYSALGHLHRPQHLESDTIRYSGSILKYSFSEVNQIKSVSMVDLDGQGACSVEQFPLTPPRDMRILEGFLADILEQGLSDERRDDYMMVSLLDTGAILDVMNKLRDVYPNVLHLERPGLMHSGETGQLQREHLKRGQMAMFRDFFKQVSGEELQPEQREIIETSLEEINRMEQQQ